MRCATSPSAKSRTAQDIGRITNGRVAAGLDTNVERQTAEGNIATSQSNLTDLDGQITTMRYQLGALLGKGPDRGLQIAKPVLESADAGRAAGQRARRPRFRAARISSRRAGRWKRPCTT